jgi:hypothetical protein
MGCSPLGQLSLRAPRASLLPKQDARRGIGDFPESKQVVRKPGRFGRRADRAMNRQYAL